MKKSVEDEKVPGLAWLRENSAWLFGDAFFQCWWHRHFFFLVILQKWYSQISTKGTTGVAICDIQAQKAAMPMAKGVDGMKQTIASPGFTV